MIVLGAAACAVAACSGSTATKTPAPAPTTRASAAATAVAGQRAFPTALATVAPTAVATAAARPTPVPIRATATFGGKVTVVVAKVTDVVSSATGPGQLTGVPAVAVTFSVRNGSGRPVALDSVDVTVTYGTAATPASPVLGDQTTPLHGTVANGSSAAGTYTFEIPIKARDNVRMTITYNAAQPSVIFSGPLH